MSSLRIIIVGASGLIGRQLLSAATGRKHNVIGTRLTQPVTGLKKFDLKKGSIKALIPDLGPRDLVFLLAGYKNPNWIYSNPELSDAVNVTALGRTLDEICASGAKPFFISSELVFDGRRGGYGEADPPRSSTRYGRQKVAIERQLQASNAPWCIVRTGATIGYRPDSGCPVAQTYQTLLSPGAHMAWDNQFSLTDVRDTGALMLYLAEHSLTGIFHLVAAPAVTRTQLAQWVLQHSRFGERMAYEPCAFDEIPYPENRPRRSWLANNKIVTASGHEFTPPQEAVKAKVRLLDQWHASGWGPVHDD